MLSNSLLDEGTAVHVVDKTKSSRGNERNKKSKAAIM